MRAGWLTGLLLTGVITAAGCDELLGTHACTDVGCFDSAVVEVQRQGVWADGAYSLDVTVDGRQYRCRFELGPRRADRETTPVIDCAPSLPPAPLGQWPTIEPVGLLEADGECTPAADGGLAPSCRRRRYRIAIPLDPSVQEVALRLAFAETVLLEQTHRLEYEKHQPNGPDCSPTCRNARLQLEVPLEVPEP